MNQRYLVGLASCTLVLAACGGGGGGGTSSTSLASPSLASPSSIEGTVPGTRIEAFGDNGSYYVISSTDDGTGEHPFELELPPGIGFRMVMITNEGTPERVVTPIAFRDSTGKVRSRLALGAGNRIDLGHVPLHMGRNAAAAEDLDGDGVIDSPMVLDDVGANNPLAQSDYDEDDMDDYNDPDHGGYHYGDTPDPQDHDDDGVPNVYDDDHVASANDTDGDGLPDRVDANPRNEENHDNRELEGDCDNDGYHDEDHDHDGFYDDDDDRDGYHDDDLDRDGRHDDDDEASDDDDDRSCGGASPTPTPGPTPSPTPGLSPTPTPSPTPGLSPTPTPSPTPGLTPTPTPSPTPTPAPTPTPTPTPLAGQALYSANCSGCHSNPARFAGISAAGIEAAIVEIGSMNSLSVLSAQQVQAIADYLATL
jgi:hypothetical protein